MTGSWTFTDHTADVGIAGTGDSAAEAIAAAGAGLFDLMIGSDSIRETSRREVEAAGLDSTDLLIAFLNELLYLFEVEGMVFRRFEVVLADEGRRLRAIGFGERFDPARHEVRIGVKAATHHAAAVERESSDGQEVWIARTIVDV